MCVNGGVGVGVWVGVKVKVAVSLPKKSTALSEICSGTSPEAAAGETHIIIISLALR